MLGPSTGPAIRYHVEHTWPAAVDVRLATQPAPLGTVHAVLAASDHVGDAPYGVGNADDVYGQAGCALLADHLRTHGDINALVGLPPGRRRDRVRAGDPGHLPGEPPTGCSSASTSGARSAPRPTAASWPATAEPPERCRPTTASP